MRLADAKPARHPFVGRFAVAVRRGEPGEQRHIRVSRLSGLAPEAVSALVVAYDETDYLDHLAEQPGFAGYLVLTAEGEVLAMSFWTSQEDRGASDEMAAAARALRIEATKPADEPVVERYEVALLRRPKALA
jgi:heme-degrading monooxygenase HmoA